MCTAAPLSPSMALSPSFIDTINSGESLAEAAQPDGVTELFPFQRQALRFMLDREKDGRRGGILADEQGVGKTVESAALIVSHRRPASETVPLALLSTAHKHPQPCGATLICCTTAILEQWQHNELERHAPGLSVVVYTGCPGGATDAELRRLAAADVVLVTYETLTRELASMSRSYESQLERRQHRHLRESVAQADEPHPSPLRYLEFWRVLLDEVQKAPGGRAAGQTVRKAFAVHRWAVTGTPIEHGKASDLTHFVSFLYGTSSPQLASWKAALASWERARQDWAGAAAAAEAQLACWMRPLLLRRLKATLPLELPPQTVHRRPFALSLPEAVLQSEFVLRQALAQCEAVGNGAGAPPPAPPAGAASGGASGERQQLLVDSAQRALLSPELWCAWGRKAQRAEESMRSRTGGADALAARPSAPMPSESTSHGAAAVGRAGPQQGMASRGLPSHLVGALVHTPLGVAISRKRTAVPTGGGGGELYANMCSAARLEASRSQASLRLLTETHLLAHGDLEVPDLLALQQVVRLCFLADRGWIKTDANNTPVPIVIAPDEPAHSKALKEADISRRRQLMFEAMGLVYHYLCEEGRDLHMWAHSDNNARDIDRTFRQYLRYSPLWDPVHRPNGEPRAIGRALPALCHSQLRWADVATFLGFEMKSRPLSEEEQLIFHKTEMYSLADRDIRSLARPVADGDGTVCRAEQWLLALGRDLGDRYEMREEMRRAAHQLLAKRLHVDAFRSIHLYHLLGEHIPVSSYDDDDAFHVRNLLGNAMHVDPLKTRESVTEAIQAVGEAAATKLAADRAAREALEEEKRGVASAHVTACRDRLRRVRRLALAGRTDGAAAEAGGTCAATPPPLAAGGSSKLAALVRLLREVALSGPLAGKVVVFTRFGEAVARVGAYLEGEGIGAVSLKADTWWRAEWKGAGRPGVSIFHRDASCAALLLEADASAAGLTLTCARHVIFLDVLNSSLLEEQAKARVNRIGQKRDTHVWHLLAKESVDEPLRDAADRKAPLRPGDGAPEAITHILRATAQRAEAAMRRHQAVAQAARAAPPAPGVGLEPPAADVHYPRVRLKLSAPAPVDEVCQ